MTWYVLNLSAADVAVGKDKKVEAAFDRCFASAGGPRLLAMFKKEDGNGGVDLFFTPECGNDAPKLLAEWACSPCERPSLIGLQLVIGHNEITYYMP